MWLALAADSAPRTGSLLPRFFYLELPVCRLQKLLRLVCRTPRRQDELVDHDLMFELIHFRRSSCLTRGDWLTD